MVGLNANEPSWNGSQWVTLSAIGTPAKAIPGLSEHPRLRSPRAGYGRSAAKYCLHTQGRFLPGLPFQPNGGRRLCCPLVA